MLSKKSLSIKFLIFHLCFDLWWQENYYYYYAFVQLCSGYDKGGSKSFVKIQLLIRGDLGQGKGGVEVDIAGGHRVTVTVSVAPAVSRLVSHLVAVQWGQSCLGGFVVLLLRGGLGAQGPVGGQHRQPDGHGDQDQEGRGRE